MRATLMYAAGDVRSESAPDPTLHEPTDAIARILNACICGSDLWADNFEELLPDTLGGTLQPGHVFDRTVTLDGVPDGYRAMADGEALRALVRP